MALWLSLGVAFCVCSYQVGLMVLLYYLALTFVPRWAWTWWRRRNPEAARQVDRWPRPSGAPRRSLCRRTCWPVLLADGCVLAFISVGIGLLGASWLSLAALLVIGTVLSIVYRCWWFGWHGARLWFPIDDRPQDPTLQNDMDSTAETYYFFAPIAWTLTSLPLFVFPLEMIARRYHRHSRADVCVSPRGLHSRGPYHPLDVDLSIVLRLCFHFWLLIGVDVLVPGEPRHLWATVVLALVLAYEMLTHTLSALFRAPSRTPRPLLLSLSGYVEAITLFAIVYRAMSLIPGVAHFGFEEAKGAQLCAWQAWRLSAVTMTTLGYGTYYPVSGAASIICSIQAIVGVVFIAVLIGGFVGLSQTGKPAA